jgi:beta-lactam-binding protein with PASTA domain
MRRLFRLVLLAMVLLLVSLVSALTAMRFAIHGREVRTPNLVGLSLPKAEGTLSESGLLLETGDSFYSQNIPEGAVVSQTPAAGTKVRRGWRVRVAVSLGASRAAVPDVVGQSGRAGEINVRRRGLDVGTLAIVHIPGLPPDQVVGESPPPNSSGSLMSPKVNLLITAPEEAQALVMPDFIGKSAAEAARAIEQAGLRLANRGSDLDTTTHGTKMPPPQGHVIHQSPSPGQKVAPGMTVILDTE